MGERKNGPTDNCKPEKSSILKSDCTEKPRQNIQKLF